MKYQFLRNGLIIMLVTSMFLTGCGASDSSSDNSDEKDTEIEETLSDTADLKEDNWITDVTIDEQVIIDGEGVTVTVTGLNATVNADVTEYYIEATVQNNTDKNLSIDFNSSSINGFSCYAVMNPVEQTESINLKFAPGETQAKISFPVKITNILPIDKIGEIIFSSGSVEEQELTSMVNSEGETVEFYESKDEAYYSFDEIVIKTSAYDESQIGKLPEGNVLYEGDGIKLITAPTDNEDILDEIFYLKNDTDHYILLNVYDLKINGETMAAPETLGIAFPRLEAPAGQVQFGYFGNDEITRSSLEIMGIGEIETIDCKLSIVRSFFYEDVMAADEIIVQDIEYSYSAE